MKVLEAKDLNLYKKLITLLGDYCLSLPATQAQKYYDLALKNGVKIMPSDKVALEILDSIISLEESVPSKIQKLLNIRFSDVQIEHRPNHKDGKRVFVAFWHCDGKTSDKVLDLINFDGGGTNGYWSNMKGEKVELITKENDAK